MTALSRRRFLIISAACAAATPLAASDARWHGTALGATASLRLVGLTDAEAAPIMAAMETEIARLENIFSLYRPQSQLSRLNRDGVLTAPAPELLKVLSLSSALHQASGGAFDPSIQPVWTALAAGTRPDDLVEVQQAIGWEKVIYDASAIRLPVPGKSALTLNGIAQGAITDRIADLLRAHGLRDVLVNMGEVAALGARGDGAPWKVGLAAPDQTVLKRIELNDRAVATSSTLATQISQGVGHIITLDGPSSRDRTVSVSAPKAAIADGLSTALCAASAGRAKEILEFFPDARIELNV
ncbi:MULTISPECIES: FAD:protein FMN transferase [Ruegeria]|uniref:FAD:protein FMN transferase n=1 Tax=Ruegeria atlantica TaxID=81569 RepID=A0ABX1WG07_9RHOB|nr:MULTISPECIES: FAD:protein FMN transferase [Ruegeria]NOD32270.1 FAD:protein FMN transferase [Ruegeria atlantica]